jgi:hypothetical protein
MTKQIVLSSFLFLFGFLHAQAQKDTLPSFSVKNKKGVITISWINTFKNTSQLNIQRSKESNRNFVTIHSSPDPEAKSYSYVDKTAKTDSGYYRIFILFEGANYVFTPAIRPTEDTVQITALDSKAPLLSSNEKEDKIAPAPAAPPKKAWEPSKFIFTGNDGNIVIQLPDAPNKKYYISFLKEEGRLLFVVPEVKEPYLILDKTNFLKSGWYYFELKEDGQVVERNKFLITRDN